MKPTPIGGQHPRHTDASTADAVTTSAAADVVPVAVATVAVDVYGSCSYCGI